MEIQPFLMTIWPIYSLIKLQLEIVYVGANYGYCVGGQADAVSTLYMSCKGVDM